jgi:hypothetical protein
MIKFTRTKYSDGLFSLSIFNILFIFFLKEKENSFWGKHSRIHNGTFGLGRFLSIFWLKKRETKTEKIKWVINNKSFLMDKKDFDLLKQNKRHF